MSAPLSWSEEFMVKERRRVLLIVIPLCVFLCVFGAVTIVSNPVYRVGAEYLYYFAIAVLVLVWVRVVQIRHRVTRWALAGYAVLAFLLMVRMHMLLGTTLVSPDSNRSVFDGVLACAPVLYIAAFLVLPKQQAIYCAFGSWVLILALTTWHMIPLVKEPDWRIGVDDTLVYTYAVSPIFIGMCWLFASYQTALHESEQRIRAHDYALQRAEKAALLDALTGIPNRRAYEENVPFQWDALAAENEQAAFLLVDVDWFKNFNDEFGHQQGDRVLQRIAAAVAEISDEHGIAYRYGGEEFAVLLPEVSKEQAREIANQIRLAISDLALFLKDKKRVTVSVGVAHSENCANESARAALRRADMAMFQAKSAGRNRVLVSELG
ncbi:MAG: GGDEF domain-containing protein [Gammaproteobacteria bacterium]|nr:GGDEF domain-containing protein [Gammaproteobacteria bacterium]